MSEDNSPITYNDALRMLERAVAEKGWNHVYTNPEQPDMKPGQGMTCLYAHKTARAVVPGCIVGHAIISDGRKTAEEVYRARGGTPYMLFDSLGIEADEDAIKLFRRVQIWQDKGVPWGAALIMGQHAPKSVYPGGSVD